MNRRRCCCNACKFRCTGTQEWEGIETQGMGSESICNCPEDAVVLFPSADIPTDIAEPEWTDVLDTSTAQWCTKYTEAGAVYQECELHNLTSGCIVDSATVSATVDWYNDSIGVSGQSVLIQRAKRYKMRVVFRTWNGATIALNGNPPVGATGQYVVTGKYDKTTGKSYIKIHIARVLELEYDISWTEKLAYSAVSPGATDLDLFYTGGLFYPHNASGTKIAYNVGGVVSKQTLSTGSCVTAPVQGTVGAKITKDNSLEAEWEIIDCDDALDWQYATATGDTVSVNFLNAYPPSATTGSLKTLIESVFSYQSPSDIFAGVSNTFLHPCQAGSPQFRMYAGSAPPPPPPPDPP